MLASRDCVEVQDRYVGDLGDYLKLGLLRWLTTGISAPHLGVVWYRTVDEAHNADGKHVAYLRDGHTTARALRPLDPDLYDGLSSIVTSGQRTTAALAEARLLPSGTVYFNDLLHLADLPIAAGAARAERRRVWLARALAATRGCDLVFADPDNGIRSTRHPAGSHRNRAVKHAYLNELATFTARGQSLVVYHHADRSAATPVQAQLRLSDLAARRAWHPSPQCVHHEARPGSSSWPLPPRRRVATTSPGACADSRRVHGEASLRSTGRTRPRLELIKRVGQEAIASLLEQLTGEIGSALGADGAGEPADVGWRAQRGNDIPVRDVVRAATGFGLPAGEHVVCGVDVKAHRRVEAERTEVHAGGADACAFPIDQRRQPITIP